jgi:hypothetical protein
MLSSAANPINAGGSSMPGDYESWSGPTARNVPFTGPTSPPQPMLPTQRTPFPNLPPGPLPTGLAGRTPIPQLPPGLPVTMPRRRRARIEPALRPVRSRRPRRRPLTPDIVIDPQSYGRSSWGGRRVITIPLDNRPTLGLRGPPKRVIEIERIPCHRRRRRRSVCYERDYDHPPPMVLPQPTTLAANPLLQPAQSSLIAPSSALLSNLTPEMIHNLPRQTVVLPPIHLPGSQANAETELSSVIFPAEIINPIDGTLSVIQGDPGFSGGGITNNQPHFAASVQPQLINMPTNIGVPIAPRGLPFSSAIRPATTGMPIAPGGLPISPGTTSDPLMQRFQELFQRLRMPQTQQTSPPIIRPTMPNMSEFNPTNNIMNNPPTGNIGSYPSSNIRPTYTPNIGSYRPATIPPANPANITPYRPTNSPPYRPSTFTPSTPVSNAMYRPVNNAPSNPSDNGPYRPANITPYTRMPNQSTGNSLSRPSFTSAPTPYASSPPTPTSESFTTFPSFSSPPSRIDNNATQSTNSTPKSILRNGSSNGQTNTPYTNFNPFNVSPSNDIVRKTARFT